MSKEWQEQLRPGVALRGIVQQATAALVAMDAARLEELAQCCVDLNRELEKTGIPDAAGDLRASENDLKLLNRVLFETRANLAVFSQLQLMRFQQDGTWIAPEGEAMYGDN